MPKLLIDKGADVNAQDNKGLTPLHVLAIVYRNLSSSDSNWLLKSLLLNGKNNKIACNYNIMNKFGQTPLYIAFIKGIIFQI